MDALSWAGLEWMLSKTNKLWPMREHLGKHLYWPGSYASAWVDVQIIKIRCIMVKVHSIKESLYDPPCLLIKPGKPPSPHPSTVNSSSSWIPNRKSRGRMKLMLAQGLLHFARKLWWTFILPVKRNLCYSFWVQFFRLEIFVLDSKHM